MPLITSFAGVAARAYGWTGALAAEDYELISTNLVSSATAQVDIDLSGLSAYKHLQIRMTCRSSRGATNDSIMFRLNGSTSSIYDIHILYGDGGSAVSAAGTNTSFGYISDFFAASSAASGNFGGAIIDILDAFSTTKNKTVRALSGNTTNANGIALGSTGFRSTSALTGFRVFSNTGSNIEAGSRFSLYGLRG